MPPDSPSPDTDDAQRLDPLADAQVRSGSVRPASSDLEEDWEDDDFDSDDSSDEFDEAQSTVQETAGMSEVELGDLSSTVEIPLTFEIGKTTVRVDALRTLLPGFTFELDVLPSAPVAIKAFGQLLGQGKLVQIDDRLGIRLMEIANDGH